MSVAILFLKIRYSLPDPSGGYYFSNSLKNVFCIMVIQSGKKNIVLKKSETFRKSKSTEILNKKNSYTCPS